MLDETIYSATGRGQAIRDWLGGDTRQPPVGIVTCRDCGGKFAYARIHDGRRFPFEPSDEGEWEISGDVARLSAGGAFVIHRCRRKL